MERMDCWLYDLVAEHRARLEAQDEGSLWLTFVGSDGRLVSAAIAGAMEHLDEVLLNNLVRVIDESQAEAVVLVVPRSDARPRAVDRRLWREVAMRVDPWTDVLDLVVLGPHGTWSMRDAMVERRGA